MSHLYRPQDFRDVEVIEIADDLAMQTARRLIREGHPVGPSSGLNFAAALQAASRLPADAVVVTVLCDRMERYFSTDLFAGWAEAIG
jgi:cysteine synthase A